MATVILQDAQVFYSFFAISHIFAADKNKNTGKPHTDFPVFSMFLISLRSLSLHQLDDGRSTQAVST